MVCTKKITPVKNGFHFEIRCDGKVKASGVRSTRALADIAASREMAVVKSVARGARPKRATTKRSSVKRATKRR